MARTKRQKTASSSEAATVAQMIALQKHMAKQWAVPRVSNSLDQFYDSALSLVATPTRHKSVTASRPQVTAVKPTEVDTPTSQPAALAISTPLVPQLVTIAVSPLPTAPAAIVHSRTVVEGGHVFALRAETSSTQSSEVALTKSSAPSVNPIPGTLLKTLPLGVGGTAQLGSQPDGATDPVSSSSVRPGETPTTEAMAEMTGKVPADSTSLSSTSLPAEGAHAAEVDGNRQVITARYGQQESSNMQPDRSNDTEEVQLEGGSVTMVTEEDPNLLKGSTFPSLGAVEPGVLRPG